MTSTLQDIARAYIDARGLSIREFAEAAGLSYQVALGVVSRASVPRKTEHRDKLRTLFELDEDQWSAILVASTGEVPPAEPIEFSPDDEPEGLQALITHEMYAQGFTEQKLADAAEVAYSTIMGITRKGSIPREDSLKKLANALKIETERLEAATAMSRAARRNPEIGSNRHEKPEDDRNLAQMVADHIQARQQTIGAFARDLGIGYLRLSRFLESGEVFEDEDGKLKTLRKMLEVDTQTFEKALARSQEEPEPAQFARKDDLLGVNANELQKALVAYMREHDLTLKALAKKADLSQVTVSRLVKQGQSPTRATTHLKLQELLEMDPEKYSKLVPLGRDDENSALTENGADAEEDDEDDEFDEDDGYEPLDMAPMDEDDEDELPEPGRTPSKDELISLVKKLGPKQRDALNKFLSTLT